MVFGQGAHDADGTAAQRKGIGGTGRDAAQGKERRNRVDFIGNAGDGTGQRLGHRGSGLTRAVGFANAKTDILGKAFEAAIVVAHHALDLGELVHHAGRKVGLAVMSRQAHRLAIDRAVPEFRHGL